MTANRKTGIRVLSVLSRCARCSYRKHVQNCSTTTRHYSTTIDKLRMATKYLFHVKLQTRDAAPTELKRRTSGRADLGINELGANGAFLGQSIVIPTKGCNIFMQYKNMQYAMFNV